MRKYLLVLLSLSLLLSEIIIRISPVFGFFLYSSLIAGCLISFSKAEKLEDYSKLAIVLMILPIIRIAELFIGFDFLWRSISVYYVLCFLVTFYTIQFKINPGYTKRRLYLLPLVILAGVTLGFIGNLFPFEKYSGFLLLLPIIAYSEEVLFRGLIQKLINNSYGGFSSIFFTSLLYSIFSLGYGLPIALFLFFVSLISCLIYHYTKNIFLTIAINLIFHGFILILT